MTTFGPRNIQNAMDRMPGTENVKSDERMTSAGRLDKMLGHDSPLMQRAATQGKQLANRRGLLNSSMAAEASQGAMIDRAQPFALQDSNNLMQNARQDANATNQRGAQKSELLGQSVLNRQQNKIQSWQMRLGSNLNRQETQQRHSQDLERLAASSSANAWGVMANNTTDIVAQGMEGIANIQANPDISRADKTKMINQITRMRDTDIRFQRDLYRNMSGFLKNSGMFPSL